MNATVARFGQKPFQVKNLGWLRRNWQEVTAFQFDYQPSDSWDGRLIAVLKCGGTYVTQFASLTVCLRWLNRPVFKGLTLAVNKRGQAAHRLWTIGDDQYSEAAKRDGGGTVESHNSHLAKLAP